MKQLQILAVNRPRSLNEIHRSLRIALLGVIRRNVAHRFTALRVHLQILKRQGDSLIVRRVSFFLLIRIPVGVGQVPDSQFLIRPELDSLLQGGNRFRKLLQRGVDVAQVRVGEPIGVQLNRLLIRRHSVLEIAHALIRGGHVVPAVGAVGFQLRDALIFFQRLGVIPEAEIGLSQCAVQRPVVGVNLDGLLERGNRLVFLAGG